MFLYKFKFFALVLSLVTDRDYLESISPALSGTFFTTEPPGKPTIRIHIHAAAVAKSLQ